MRRRIFTGTVLGWFLAPGCRTVEGPPTKAIVGATLIDGTGAPPLDDGVILVSGSRIEAVGPRATVPIAARFDKFDGRGKYIVPEAPVEVLIASTQAGRLELPKGSFATLREGQPADLLVLSADPLSDTRNYRRVERRMTDGDWAK